MAVTRVSGDRVYGRTKVHYGLHDICIATYTMMVSDFSCNLCGSVSFDSYLRFEDYGTSILSCTHCGLMVSYPFPDQQQIYRWYQDAYYSAEGVRFSKLAESVARFFRIRRAHFLDRRFGPGKAILDVGCGRGIMLHELMKRGWLVAGTQLSETAAAYIRRNFKIYCFIGDLPRAPFKEGSFDIITLWHVLEHLRDPLLYLAWCRRLLKPGGYILIETPNANSWSARFMRGAWMGWDPRYHLHHFTPATLNRALRKAGFLPLAQGHFSWEYGPFTTLQSLLNCYLSRDILFEALRFRNQGNAERIRIAKERPLIFLQALLWTLPALTISLASAMCSNGEIIYVMARAAE